MNYNKKTKEQIAIDNIRHALSILWYEKNKMSDYDYAKEILERAIEILKEGD